MQMGNELNNRRKFLEMLKKQPYNHSVSATINEATGYFLNHHVSLEAFHQDVQEQSFLLPYQHSPLKEVILKQTEDLLRRFGKYYRITVEDYGNVDFKEDKKKSVSEKIRNGIVFGAIGLSTAILARYKIKSIQHDRAFTKWMKAYTEKQKALNEQLSGSVASAMRSGTQTLQNLEKKLANQSKDIQGITRGINEAGKDTRKILTRQLEKATQEANNLKKAGKPVSKELMDLIDRTKKGIKDLDKMFTS